MKKSQPRIRVTSSDRESSETAFDHVWIGSPALLAGEDKDAYLRLRDEIEEAVAPRTIFDRIRVQELTDQTWEAERLKRTQVGAILSARVQSLAMLLLPSVGENSEKALKLAQDCFSSDEVLRQKARKIVDGLEISDAMIDANATHLRIQTIDALDSLRERRESKRYRLIKEQEKRKRKEQRQDIVQQRSAKDADQVVSLPRLKRR
ncbi:MAG: hypothetical protein J0H51_04785 [Rhizobiales bacterium]|nr:hypothetical protein [Hyphomicrobiales bacterium]